MPPSLLVIKLPALLIAMFAEYVTYTPPNRPPMQEETAGYDGGDLISRYTMLMSGFIVGCAWFIHGCEVVNILAQELPGTTSAIPAPLFHVEGERKLSIQPMFLIGFSLIVLGTSIRKACYTALGRLFTFQLAILKEHKLVTWGPYSIVRHPAYTGVIAASIGMLAMQLSSGSWLAVSGALNTPVGRSLIGAWVGWTALTLVGLVRRVSTEDAVLRKEFGAHWDAWAKKTPYALVPYIY
ncbi:hypothetical protein BN946_scf184901.g7 [Trametes cinnabarina]|uniref:Protein-S-isoprenylcysteine O-methyltransferase n=1 Tax=Pycnoporus cinnabarinus TaxID=5643 RepID=A0A060SR92_PYCCI|nr:hypothetical protein BN946_scf184901.g7 [Trametes cinnabarina]